MAEWRFLRAAVGLTGLGSRFDRRLRCDCGRFAYGGRDPIGLYRHQPAAQSIQVRQADQHHHLGGVLCQPAIAHLSVAELPLDDAEEMLDPRPDPRIPAVAFLLATGERCPEAPLGFGLVLDAP